MPSVLREVFFSDRLNSATKDATIFGHLNPNSDQPNILEKDLIDIILGRTSLNKFSETLKSHLNIPDANLTIINKIIQDKIFEPLKDDLNQLKINQPELTFSKIPQKESIMPQKPFKIPEEKIIKTEEIKELFQEQKPLEAVKIEVITKKEVLPDLSLPEIQKIKIERPVDRTGGFKKIIMPSASPEAQEKIHSKLMEAMNKKEVKPKIIEEMKKVVIEGIKKPPKQKSKPKKTPETEESLTSQVIGGEGKQFTSQEKVSKFSLEKPYIFNVKLKEEEEKKQGLPKEEIKYQRPTDKPFGEA
ncbi:MAG: hypothetical protein WC306_02895 [Candidatus Paceibacterota bacterium]